MTRYFQRATKYFFSLGLLYLVMIYIMSLTSMLALSPGETITSMLLSSRGARMLAAMVALAAAYPLFGFMKRVIAGDLSTHRDVIVATMLSQGFTLSKEQSGELVFRAGNFFRRLTLVFEDHVVLRQTESGKIEISGNRRSVAYSIFRLEFAIGKSAKPTSTDDLDE